MTDSKKDWKTLYRPGSGEIIDVVEGLGIGKKGYASYLKNKSKCSERVVYWSGKSVFNVFQRYEEVLFWWGGKFEPSQDSAWLSRDILFRCTHEKTACELIILLEKELPKGAKRLPFLWYDEQQGILMRAFLGPNQRLPNGTLKATGVRIGVYRNHWIVDYIDPEIHKTFSSETEAIEAYEKVELEFLVNGGFLRQAAPFRIVKIPKTLSDNSKISPIP